MQKIFFDILVLTALIVGLIWTICLLTPKFALLSLTILYSGMINVCFNQLSCLLIARFMYLRISRFFIFFCKGLGHFDYLSFQRAPDNTTSRNQRTSKLVARGSYICDFWTFFLIVNGGIIEWSGTLSLSVFFFLSFLAPASHHMSHEIARFCGTKGTIYWWTKVEIGFCPAEKPASSHLRSLK